MWFLSTNVIIWKSHFWRLSISTMTRMYCWNMHRNSKECIARTSIHGFVYIHIFILQNPSLKGLTLSITVKYIIHRLVTFIVLWKFTVVFQYERNWTLYVIQTTYFVERDYFITQSIQQYIKNVVSVACIHYENWRPDLTIIRISFRNISLLSYQLNAKREC